MGGFGQAFKSRAFQFHLLDERQKIPPVHVQVELRFSRQAGPFEGEFACQLAHGQQRLDRPRAVFELADL